MVSSFTSYSMLSRPMLKGLVFNRSPFTCNSYQDMILIKNDHLPSFVLFIMPYSRITFTYLEKNMKKYSRVIFNNHFHTDPEIII